MGNSPSKRSSTQKDSGLPSYEAATARRQPHKRPGDDKAAYLDVADEEPYPFGSSPRSKYAGPQQSPYSIEDALEMLKQYDTVIVVDDSGSMQHSDHPSLPSRWSQAGRLLANLGERAAQYDQDGIDIYFLNHGKPALKQTSAAQIRSLFGRVKPNGATTIGGKLEEILRKHVKDFRDATNHDTPAPKPVNILVLTDGAATDDPKSVIVTYAKQLDELRAPTTQIGIQFVQIGNNERAARYLDELDNDLAGVRGLRDMVDTTRCSEIGGELTLETLIKVLLGGINRRVDNKGGRSVM